MHQFECSSNCSPAAIARVATSVIIERYAYGAADFWFETALPVPLGAFSRSITIRTLARAASAVSATRPAQSKMVACTVFDFGKAAFDAAVLMRY